VRRGYRDALPILAALACLMVVVSGQAEQSAL